MKECGPPFPPAPYKGAGWGLGRPAQLIKTQKEQGTGTGPLPRPTTARFPASTVRRPKRMEAAWKACRTKATDEATSPHPVIVGSGRLENRAPAPYSPSYRRGGGRTFRLSK